MQYLVYNLDYQKKDSVVEVTLSSATNVRLMDSMNFDLYKNNQQHVTDPEGMENAIGDFLDRYLI